MSSYLPKSLKLLSERAPDLHLRIYPGSSRALFEEVQMGELDAALLVAPPFDLPKSLHFQTLAREPLCFVSPFAPDGDGPEAIGAAMQSLPFIRYDPLSWGGQLAELYCTDFGLHPDILCDLDGPETICQMVAEGMGTSLLPYWPALTSGISTVLHGAVGEEKIGDTSIPRLHITPIPQQLYERQVGLVYARHGEKQAMLDMIMQCLLDAAPSP